MLNRELLMVGASKAQKEVRLTVGYNVDAEAFGMYYTFPGFSIGAMNVLPYWDTASFLQGILEDELTRTLHVSLSAPNPGFSLRIKNSRGSNQLTWPSGDSLTAFDKSALTLRDDVNTEIILTFDPPRWVLGSKDTRTDLGREYYVEEEDPLEAQNAEQGTSDDGWRRGVVDSTIQVHRGPLYRSIPRRSNRSAAYSLGRKSEYGYCNDSHTSKEYPTTYTHWRSLHEHTRKWVYNRILQRTRNSNHSVSKRGVFRVRIRRMISKEALYA